MSSLRDAHLNPLRGLIGTVEPQVAKHDCVTLLNCPFEKRCLVADGIGEHRLKNEAGAACDQCAS